MSKNDFIGVASSNGLVCCYSRKEKVITVKRPGEYSRDITMSTIEKWDDSDKAIDELKNLKLWN